MIKTIQAALSPLLIIISICGLGFFEYPRGQLRPYLSCLYFLITWSLYVYLFYYLIYRSIAPDASKSWFNIITMLSAIISIIVSLFRFKELTICLNKISVVDDTLEMLGTPKEYRRLYNWVIRMIIVWIILVFLVNGFDALYLNYNYLNITRIITPFVGNHLYHINSLSGLTWGIILGHVHLQLCLILRELNKVFSTQMTMQMAVYFALFIELFRVVYTSYIDKHTSPTEHVMARLFFYIWCAIYGVTLLALNHICQITCDKANETIAILHKLSNDSPDKNLREQTLQFVLQIRQRELKFSGMGLFYFGYSFIRKFCVSVMTVTVIVIQMRISHAGDEVWAIYQ